MAEFAHLHLNTDYSLLDGVCEIERLMAHIPVFRICSRVSAGKVPATCHGCKPTVFHAPSSFIGVCVWGWADPAPRGSSPECTRPSTCSREGLQSRLLDSPSLGHGPDWRRMGIASSSCRFVWPEP